MRKQIERKLEKIIKEYLCKSRHQVINKVVQRFQDKFNNLSSEALTKHVEVLRGRLNTEADRVFTIVDRSILRATIQKARWKLLIGGIFGAIGVGFIFGASFGSATTYLIPLTTASLNYLLELSTIPFQYNQRVKAGMETIVNTYVKEIEKNPSQSTSAQVLKEMKVSPPQEVKVDIVPTSNNETNARAPARASVNESSRTAPFQLGHVLEAETPPAGGSAPPNMGVSMVKLCG